MASTSLDASTPVCPLYISGIIVDFSKSKKNVESAEVRISLQSPTPIKSRAAKVLRQTFSPPMKLSHGDTFSLHVRYKKWHGMKTNHEDIVFEPEDMFRECSAGERREYNKVHKNITVVVELSGNPTAKHDEMFLKCPQFRILVIGKTGVGKTSLINCAFGVQNAIPAHERPGEASIDYEFISPQNDRFVLHDSKGFEPGSIDNLKIVRDFIDRRGAMHDLKDKLHAVWLCFQIPRAGGGLLETGVEQFLTSKLRGELGNIPIVIVFTKYDLLLERVERILDESAIKGLSKAAIQELTENSAKDELQEICIAPLETLGSGIPHVTVSSGCHCYDCHLRSQYNFEHSKRKSRGDVGPFDPNHRTTRL